MKTTTPFYILGFLLLLNACVSVNLGVGGDSKRASGVEVSAPDKPFDKQSRDDVDAAWKNERNGNVISYLSDCQDPSDPPLDQIVSGVLSGLSSMKIESKETVTVQSREGRRVLASGKVDGVPSMTELLVFKRNQCIYILSLVGVSPAFNEDRAQFQRFVSGFRAP